MTKDQVKKRLVGAIVLVSLAIIFIPMMLDSRGVQKPLVSGIPARDTGPYKTDLAEAKPIPIAPVARPAEPVPEPPQAAPVTSVEPKPVTQPVAAAPVVTSLTAWVIQVGSFSKQEGAESTAGTLRKAGFDTLIEKAKVNGETVFRVQVGPEADKARAEALQKQIKTQLKLDGRVMSYPSN